MNCSVASQFKWLEPEETGGRPILRYQACILREGGDSGVEADVRPAC